MSLFCISCGIENSDEAKFCKSCGQPLKTEEYQEFDKKENTHFSEEDMIQDSQTSIVKTGSFSPFSFSGCISRKTYWSTHLVITGILLFLGILFAILIPKVGNLDFSKIPFSKESAIFITVLGLIILLWIGTATMIKRLRDANFSPWLAFLAFIPYLGAIIILVMNGFFPSVEHANKYCKSRNNLSSNAIKWIYISTLVPFVLVVIAIVVPKYMSSNESSQEEVYYQYQRTNNTFYDTETGLIWQDDSDEKNVVKDWSGAKEYCNNLSLDRYNDWYLPSKEQLSDLYKKREKLKNTFSNYYWSSTTNANNTSSAWIVDFGDGFQSYYGKTYYNDVRCVRAGQ